MTKEGYIAGGDSPEFHFKNDLRELMKRYKVRIRTVKRYDTDDNYCGSTVFFKGERIHFEIDDSLNE